MSWTSVWIHMVFATKYRTPFLKDSIRKQVFLHMKANAEAKGIHLDVVNGYTEHAHCLISLNRDQTISNIAQLIKGESSFWINKKKLTTGNFMWQDDYWAVSVSERHIARVRQYILNQEEHHKKKTFKEESDKFVRKYGWPPLYQLPST
ncbi:IS200/IS605 family transposase [Dyadobacter sp. MSC1_007]|jgi:putative transposase|uniref:IS200/IS605 family transposase n=1 Tax=Dyadobacter sp. MSC1_007 TaxID=2909264 RepID=UPI0020309007|nr:IS200/IS605 family transposase [Dyadobacter sp. MSC1_007]